MPDVVNKTVTWECNRLISLSVNVACKADASEAEIFKLARFIIIKELCSVIEDDFFEYLDNLGDWSIVEQ